MVNRHQNTRTRPDKSLEKYLNEIGNYTPLSPKREIELAQEIRKGSSAALDLLVKSNLRFVITVAKDYQGQGLPLQDLINEGNLGLIKAAQRFDETRGFKFISYAVWWIRQAILQALAEHSRVVRLPLNQVGSVNKVLKLAEKLEKKLERPPDRYEVYKAMGGSKGIATPEDIDWVLKNAKKHVSLDAPLGDSKESLFDVLEDTSFEPTDCDALKSSLPREIENVLDTLTEREAQVIVLYFGLGRPRPLTLEEIGEKFKLTRERVRQIKEKAIRRLRYKSRLEPLRKYLG